MRVGVSVRFKNDGHHQHIQVNQQTRLPLFIRNPDIRHTNHIHKSGYTMRPICVYTPDRSWPAYFVLFRHQISRYLNQADVPFISITHIGSTSIPDLAAKDNIDIVILVANAALALAAAEALVWEPEPAEHYKNIGNGGIQGRISLKLKDLNRRPARSVYIVHQEDKQGMLSFRGYGDLKRVLMANEGLRREYEAVKLELVAQGVDYGVLYGQAKNEVIAKVLREAGWSEEEIKSKEALDQRKATIREWDWPY